MGRDDFWDDDDPLPNSRADCEDDGNDMPLRLRRGQRSGAVTSVAVLNLLAGPLMLIFGFCAGALSIADEREFLGIPSMNPSPSAYLALILIAFVWSVGCVAAGIGLLFRASWSRTWTLALGGFAAMIGLMSLGLMILFIGMGQGTAPSNNKLYLIRATVQAVFFLGYPLWAYSVLLNPRYLDDFRSR